MKDSNGRKIAITEQQHNEMMRLMESEAMASETLPKHLVRDITYNNTSLSDLPFFSTPNGKRYLQKMTLDRYNEVLGNFSDDVAAIDKDRIETELTKTISRCMKKEDAIRNQLEDMCVEVLTETFNLPDNSFSLKCSLIAEVDKEKSFAVNPSPVNAMDGYDTMQSMNDEMTEIQKRRMLDCFAMGAAMRIFSKCRKIYLDKLFDLDEELPYLYSRFEKLNELYLFSADVRIRDRAHQQGGFVEVSLGNNDVLPRINACGILFPIMLTEAIKGFVELFISHGLPDDMATARKVIDVADALENEPWDMRIGPVLFDSFIDCLDDAESTAMPYFMSELSMMDGGELMEVMKGCICHSQEAEDILNDIYDGALEDAEYEDFECDIMQKQDDDTLITDQEEI